MIRDAAPEDIRQICDIYNYYIENTVVTFEEQLISEEIMAARIEEIKKTAPFLVYVENGTVTGYAYASRWKERSAYRYSLESTIYLKNEYTGQGMGSALYTRLLEILKSRNIHTVMGVIALPNEKSERLHEKLGFVKSGHLKEAGYKFDQWIDVGYWQLLL